MGSLAFQHRQLPIGNEEARDFFALQLKNCRSLDEGKRVHSQIVANEQQSNRFLGNLLVQMYGRHGSLDLARQSFEQIQEPNVFSWTVMVAAYAQNGYQGAFQALCQMQNQGVAPNAVTFVSVLKACRGVAQARKLHRLIALAGFGEEDRILSGLVHLYGSCGCVDDAKQFFDRLKGNSDVVSWTSLMGAFVNSGQGAEALRIFQMMNHEGIKADKVCLVSFLDACASEKDFQQGKHCHDLLLPELGLDTDLALQNSLLNMYGKCGRLDEAIVVFGKISAPDLVSWNSILSAYSHNGQPDEALCCFREVLLDGVKPGFVTFIAVMQACSCLEDSKRVVAMHGSCRNLVAAKKIYDLRPSDEFSGTSMIAAYVHNHEFSEALRLFRSLLLQGIKPNKVTFLSILDACSNIGDFAEAETILGFVGDAGLEDAHEIGNAIVNMFGKCGRADQAKEVFDRKKRKDVVTWTGLAGAYARNQQANEAFKTFERMQLDGVKPNKVTFVVLLDAFGDDENSLLGRRIDAQMIAQIAETGLRSNLTVGNCLINYYVKQDRLEDAAQQLQMMDNRNLTTLNTMIFGYARRGDQGKVLELLSSMDLQGMIPDSMSFTGVLDACTSTGGLACGQIIHERVCEAGELQGNPVLGTSLVNFYGKSGSLENARVLFEEVCSSGDTVLWNAMIGAYARNGFVEESGEIFRRLILEGCGVPDKVTFVAVLSAFSHEEEAAEEWLSVMINDFGIEASVEHYSCLIDLLARKGRLAVADELLRRMPFQAQGMNLVSLLAACKLHGDLKRAESVAKLMMDLDTKQAPAYVLLSDVYAGAG